MYSNISFLDKLIEWLNKNKIIKIFIFSLPLCIYNSNMVISIMIGLYYLKFLENNIYISSFSIGMGYYYLFANFINFGFSEIIGLKVSKSYGKKNITKCSNYYFKSLLLLIIFITLFYPTFQNMDDILIFFKNNVEQSIIVGKFFRKFFYVMIIISLNRLNESYWMSQEKTKLFILINIFTIVILPFLCNYFILIKDFKLEGMILSFFLKELLCFILGLINFYYQAEIEFIKFKLIIKNFFKFFIFSIYIIISLISESIGIQSILLFLGVLGDPKEIIIWGMMLNIFDLNFFIGYSFSNGIRTYVSNLIGQKKYKESKKLNDKFFYVAIFIVLLEIIFINYNSNYVAQLFTLDKEIDSRFVHYFRIYSFYVINDFTFGMFSTTLRVIKRFRIQSILIFVGMCIVQPILGFILIIKYNYGLIAGFYIYVLTAFILNCIQFLIYITFNWSDLYKIENNNENIKLIEF